jgi:hypothetical protein
MSPFVAGFGCRLVMVVPRGLAAGVRKPAMDETAMVDVCWCRGRHNFEVTAQILLKV